MLNGIMILSVVEPPSPPTSTNRGVVSEIKPDPDPESDAIKYRYRQIFVLLLCKVPLLQLLR